MSKFKAGNIVALMCLLWLVIFVTIAVFLPEWVGFGGIIACTLPMLLFKQKHRKSASDNPAKAYPFGQKNGNSHKYHKP